MDISTIITNPKKSVQEQHAKEMAAGERFGFGNNWNKFLSEIDEKRISEAERSLKMMLGVEDLAGKRFLDIGCGSGIFSLAARKLGAYVHSFDYDRQSVACAEKLKSIFYPKDNNWQIEQGSVLDQNYLLSLGLFDVVYAWGVLHHTGSMWQAIDNAASMVKSQGQLFIAIYNDRGLTSKYWKYVKHAYNSWSPPLKMALQIAAVTQLYLPEILRNIALKGSVRVNDCDRGMSHWRDTIDWIGGYPYEYAKADEIFNFVAKRQFQLQQLKTDGGLGCNEFVFQRL